MFKELFGRLFRNNVGDENEEPQDWETDVALVRNGHGCIVREDCDADCSGAYQAPQFEPLQNAQQLEGGNDNG